MKKCPFCAEEIQDEAIVCRYCGRDLPDVKLRSSKQELPRPLHWFWYLVIGVATLLIFAALLFGASLIYSVSLNELETDNTAIIIASLLMYVLIWLLATRGRYGNFKILNLLVILVWSLIPILNWGIVYYLGKGMYMLVSGQEYRSHLQGGQFRQQNGEAKEKWINNFIEHNFLPIAHTAYDGYMELGRGIVGVNETKAVLAPSFWNNFNAWWNDETNPSGYASYEDLKTIEKLPQKWVCFCQTKTAPLNKRKEHHLVSSNCSLIIENSTT